ncbi:cytochrome P450 [Dentipellis sp. KUC8613]|nr:cytochrome P450 [Dentipellis sp. KUC8613]
MQLEVSYRLLLATFLFGTLCAAFIVSKRRRSSVLPWPPGPPSLPLVGNWMSLPSQTPWKTYAKWSRDYNSDVVSINAFGKVIVVINTAKAAQALLEQRSAIYSDRPFLTIVTLSGWDWFLGFIPYSDKWRVRRRIFQSALREQACEEYRPMQHTMAENMVKWLYEDPKDFQRYTNLTASWLTLSLAWGYDAKPRGDTVVKLMEDAAQIVIDLTLPGTSVLNEIPLLRQLPGWFPGMGYKARANECRNMTERILHGPMKSVKQSLKADGTARESMASKLLRADEGVVDLDAEMAIRDTVGSVYSAGAETTGSAIHFAFLALVLNPHVQRRAQEEIDRVVGRDRLPTLNDRSILPYVGAVLRESMRWNNVTPMGIPHKASEDDVYEGHFIPKGAIVFGNIWAIMHDPAKYPDPTSFRPERFLQEDGTLNDDDIPMIFGFGRRVCPGKFIADSSVWLAVASLLAVYNLSPAQDEHGHDIPVKEAVVDGLTSRPLPFECSIKPRDSIAEALIKGLA